MTLDLRNMDDVMDRNNEGCTRCPRFLKLFSRCRWRVVHQTMHFTYIRCKKCGVMAREFDL